MPDKPRSPHGTKHDPKRQHPVLDTPFWETKFPLRRERREGGCINGPGDIARIEQARQLAKSMGDLGPSVPADFFVWSMGNDPARPWLTQLGGQPWRDNDKPWPKDADGIPLHFLGQICFADSRDILPSKLPGEVALIFGRWQDGWTFADETAALEWSPLKLKNPTNWTTGWTTRLPFCYQGVIHRSVQYTNAEMAEQAFIKAGWKYGGWCVQSIQTTSIGTYASLPQGWPFETKSDGTLIATLSSFYFRGRWPLCNVPQPHRMVRKDGSKYDPISTSSLSFGLGDAGCTWIYRDKNGKFKVDGACG